MKKNYIDEIISEIRETAISLNAFRKANIFRYKICQEIYNKWNYQSHL